MKIPRGTIARKWWKKMKVRMSQRDCDFALLSPTTTACYGNMFQGGVERRFSREIFVLAIHMRKEK
jgi:hypothetical protein